LLREALTKMVIEAIEVFEPRRQKIIENLETQQEI
jgi:hypothetical protein